MVWFLNANTHKVTPATWKGLTLRELFWGKRLLHTFSLGGRGVVPCDVAEKPLQ